MIDIFVFYFLNWCKCLFAHFDIIVVCPCLNLGVSHAVLLFMCNCIDIYSLQLGIVYAIVIDPVSYVNVFANSLHF